MNYQDILSQVLSHLELRDIVVCEGCSKFFRKICRLQYARLIECYRDVPISFPTNVSFKHRYTICYGLDQFRKKECGDVSLIRFFSNDILNLAAREITTIPRKLEWLGLSELSLSDNSINMMPKHLFRLTKLQKLSLDGNNLVFLPDRIGCLTNLKELVLFKNKLEKLPESITCLTNLQILWTGFNHLTELPKRFGILTNLQTLSLQYNKFKEIQCVGELIYLRRLWIKNNPILELPQSIGQLRNLKLLSFRGTKITKLPQSTAIRYISGELHLEDGIRIDSDGFVLPPQ